MTIENKLQASEISEEKKLQLEIELLQYALKRERKRRKNVEQKARKVPDRSVAIHSIKGRNRIAEGLEKAERKLSSEQSQSSEEDDLEQRELDDLDDVDLATIEKLEKKGVRIIYPNLKYRKPKYQNVESILNYVEDGEEEKGGVKLVIMNFND